MHPQPGIAAVFAPHAQFVGDFVPEERLFDGEVVAFEEIPFVGVHPHFPLVKGKGAGKGVGVTEQRGAGPVKAQRTVSKGAGPEAHHFLGRLADGRKVGRRAGGDFVVPDDAAGAALRVPFDDHHPFADEKALHGIGRFQKAPLVAREYAFAQFVKGLPAAFGDMAEQFGHGRGRGVLVQPQRLPCAPAQKKRVAGNMPFPCFFVGFEGNGGSGGRRLTVEHRDSCAKAPENVS